MSAPTPNAVLQEANSCLALKNAAPTPDTAHFPPVFDADEAGFTRRCRGSYMMPETPPGSETRLRGPKRSKACDQCKMRKIRCSGYPPPCGSCMERGATCHFGRRKVPLRKNVNKALLSNPVIPSDTVLAKLEGSSTAIEETHHALHVPEKKVALQVAQGDLFIDRVLFGAPPGNNLSQEQCITLKGNGLFSRLRNRSTWAVFDKKPIGGTYRLTFFSDSRLESLSTKLRNNKVNDLVRRISTILKNRVRSPDTESAMSSPPESGQVDNASAARHIAAYYERVHPLFPHLDRASFESKISSPNLPTILAEEPAFSALYHLVLALGCLHSGGGSFEPGKGKAWKLFSVALPLIPDLEKSNDPLVALQAITTAAVYALGISCLSIEQRIMTQAGRMAQDLGPAIAKGPSAKAFHRIFWVLYCIEKMSSFHFGRSSTLVDAEIITPMPHFPESMFGSFNWTLTFARHSRLLSRAMTTLFCAGICQKGLDYYTTTISQLFEDLEQWRLSIPEGLRPGPSCQPHLFRRPVTGPSAIWINYLYYSFKLILLRCYLQVNGERDQSESNKNLSREHLIAVSRSILEIITYVDVEPSTPLWILAGIPICALFVLFDQVINDPTHPDTRSNLALLDIAGGHFSRIEFASEGSLPGSLIAEFAYIAREYVNETTSQGLDLGGSLHPQRSHGDGMSSLEMPEVPGSADRPMSKLDKGTDVILPPTTLETSQDIASMGSALYFTPQDSWMGGSDLLLGIDVMDIFNNLS
ncbi:hypothetical protein MRS44_012049 [Fusarium solani]|uniref:uncharacterized protein n=1 Tax=Fusarium solani TaxID=169388 RepID=UPI00231E836F|nr:hypothetical protein MRS44_012049 [Fusarium solani]KAJ4232981.1 hypothetical protein NW759_001764 [Fusarium solani]